MVLDEDAMDTQGTRLQPRDGCRSDILRSAGWLSLWLSVTLVACSRSGPSPGALEENAAGSSAPGPAAEMVTPADPGPASRAAPPQDTLVDEAKLRQAFAGASSAHQLFLEEALAVSRLGHGQDALEHFQKLLKHPGLTPEQRAVIQEAIGRLQARSRQRRSRQNL